MFDHADLGLIAINQVGATACRSDGGQESFAGKWVDEGAGSSTLVSPWRYFQGSTAAVEHLCSYIMHLVEAPFPPIGGRDEPALAERGRCRVVPKISHQVARSCCVAPADRMSSLQLMGYYM